MAFKQISGFFRGGDDGGHGGIRFLLEIHQRGQLPLYGNHMADVALTNEFLQHIPHQKAHISQALLTGGRFGAQQCLNIRLHLNQQHREPVRGKIQMKCLKRGVEFRPGQLMAAHKIRKECLPGKVKCPDAAFLQLLPQLTIFALQLGDQILRFGHVTAPLLFL